MLLDEVEKAHPEVFDVLLQVLDDGRLTDGQGRTVDFRNAILILTSNLGSQFLVDPALDDGRPSARRCMAAVRGAFKPEFLNRLDDVVVFDALGTEELAAIVDLQVEPGWPGGWPTAGSPSTVTDAAAEWLALTGFDPVYGARPLRRLVQTRRSATSWPGRCWPARSATATTCSSTWSKVATASSSQPTAPSPPDHPAPVLAAIKQLLHALRDREGLPLLEVEQTFMITGPPG